MTMQKNWINVSYKDVVKNDLKSDNKKQNGITMHFMTSPMNVPKAWRIFDIKSFFGFGAEYKVIEFEYLSNNEPIRRRVYKRIKFKIGKNSGRIYEIRAKKTDLQNSEIQIFVIPAIEEYKVNTREKTGNADAIEMILSKKNGSSDYSYA